MILVMIVPKEKKAKKCVQKGVHPVKEVVTSQGKVVKSFNVWNVAVEWEMLVECDWIPDYFYFFMWSRVKVCI